MHISMHDGAGHEDLPTRSENHVILRPEPSHSECSSENPEQKGLVYFLHIYSSYIKPSIRLLVSLCSCQHRQKRFTVNRRKSSVLSSYFSFLTASRQQRFLRPLCFCFIYRARCLYIFPGNKISRPVCLVEERSRQSASVRGLEVVDRRAGGC